ncbi:AAA family ATPase [Nocardiopsis potens]|uniref:AAA family ATPase n=1 Tax=Nocardiopsis potens TaxID=1246458 RepID=UPI00034A36D1|nr:ATP-binding protein [Nocardiopsis potens]
MADPGPGGPAVVFMCGPAGSGKTTVARRLEAGGHVRLSIDEEAWNRGWRRQPLPDGVAAAIEDDLRRRLIGLVSAGADVVLDYSFWSRRMRDRYRRLLAPLGVVPVLVHLATPRETALDRIRRRDGGDANAVRLGDEVAAGYHDSFEPPEPGEGPVAVVRPGDDPGALPAALAAARRAGPRR